MPDPTRLHTPAEAAAVSGLALKAVNNAIDKHIVDIVRPTAAAAGRRTRLEHALVGRLPVERRQGLFREVAA